MPTNIKLQDGVNDGGRQLTELTLRNLHLTDLFAMAALDLGKLSDALKFIARLSDEPLDLLQWMTQNDVHVVLLGLSEHVDKFQNGSRR